MMRHISDMSESSKKILSFYDEHIDTYAAGPRAVGWSDERSQQARFAALCTVGDLNGCSVLDVGSGLGDLSKYLGDRYANVRYTGVDINPRYIERTRQLYPDASFEVADFAEYGGGPFDYVVASGAFSVLVPNYKEIYFGQIRKMFAMARKGIACTMLDERYHPSDGTYAVYAIDEVREFCLTFTDDVSIKNDYLPHDFTVIMRKENG